MKTSNFDYNLPPELIAQQPTARRDASRMLVLRRGPETIEHRGVSDLPGFLRADDLLVLNDTRVIPARIFGYKEKTGGKVEFLLLEETEPGMWDALLRCARRPKKGDKIVLGTPDEPADAVAELIEDGEMGRARICIKSKRPFMKILEERGFAPLPPYISRDYKTSGNTGADRERYQTIYAENPGAVAAPTAGLHFSEELFKALEKSGVKHTTLTLHVGIGTFRPVSVETVEEHRMDAERYEISAETAGLIEKTRREGGRVVAVGSTTVRTLEAVAAEHGKIIPCSGRTECFIYPPYEFKVVDVMLTNFHLPRSTLLMMVCALAGKKLVLHAYDEAVRKKYRFYSYGDCMLIV